MAAISSVIQLTDMMTGPLMNITNALNQTLSAFEDMQNACGNAFDDSSLGAARQEIDQANAQLSEMERQIRENAEQQNRHNEELNEGRDAAEGLKNMIVGVASAYLGMAGIRKAKSWIEETTAAFNVQRNAEMQLMTVLANTLDTDYVAQYAVEASVTADTTEAVQAIEGIQDSVGEVEVPVSADVQALQGAYRQLTEKASEIQGRGIYGDEAMIGAAAEFSTYFTDTDAIEMMMDTLADYAMGMSGGGELDTTAMVDYATNLGKIMSGSYDAMTKKGFEFTDAQKAIIEGEATREQIIEAVGEEYLDLSEDMQAAAAISAVIEESWAGLYEKMSDTPEGKIIQMNNTWGDMKEVVGGQLYPYVILLVDAITSHWGTIESIISGFTSGLQVAVGILSLLLDGALNFAQLINDNWSLIEPVIWGIIAALVVYNATMGIGWLTTLKDVAAKGMAAAANMAHAASAFVTTAAQQGLNAALAACPITWIIIGVIALVTLLVVLCNRFADTSEAASSGFGVMTGGISVVIQFFRNLGLTVADIALGIWNALGACATNLRVAFYNAISDVQTWFYNLLSTALTVIGNICEALNKLPFVEFDYSGITSAADKYADKASEAAKDKQEYADVGDAFRKGFGTFDTFQSGWASDAFAAGAAWGDGITNKVSNFSLTDMFETTDIPSVEDWDPAYTATGPGSVADNVASAAGSAADLADSVDITNENLKYLRDIAETEVINRFTTAEVKVEQNNYNTVNSGLDIDGMVTQFTEGMNEAIELAAEGVHD